MGFCPEERDPDAGNLFADLGEDLQAEAGSLAGSEVVEHRHLPVVGRPLPG